MVNFGPLTPKIGR